jgi:mRNA-degrading endonuclease RelE of RelBE toxin-antitoxin system
MPSYRIEFKRPARKALADIQTAQAKRIRVAIDALADDPFPQGHRKDIYR